MAGFHDTIVFGMPGLEIQQVLIRNACTEKHKRRIGAALGTIYNPACSS